MILFRPSLLWTMEVIQSHVSRSFPLPLLFL